MEENLLNKIISGSNTVPPKLINDVFLKEYNNAINTEWFIKEDFYEAIFYLNEIEHIVRYNNSGVLIDKRKNMFIKDIPNHIKEVASNKGEIMNTVEISYPQDEPKYNIIVRNSDLIRFILLINNYGEIIEEKML